MKKALLALLAVGLTAITVDAAVITQWTFEGETLTPSTGTGTATLGTGSTSTFPAGWATTDSWSSNGWASGEYFQFQISTTGYEDITVSWEQTGSNTGPRDFNFQYSLDGTSFTTFSSVAAITNDGWNGSSAPVASVRSMDLSAIAGIEDVPTVYFRITAVGTTAVTGGTVAAAGTSRVDTFTVNGTLVPEPTTAAMTFGGVGMMLWTLRRRRSIQMD